MESPNRKNMYLANDFMNSLKKKYKANVTFILGNHDVIVHGFNMARNQKSKVIAYLLGENIKVIENENNDINKVFEGMKIVLTGTLPTLKRNDAKEC